MQKDTLAIILNWNSPEDTTAAALAVLQEQGADVVIADNGSTDNSLQKISALLEQAGITAAWQSEEQFSLTDKTQNCFLLAGAVNYGFAGAINRVLRHAGGYRFFWLLNNDALPAPGALKHLEHSLKANPELGFAGSVIADFTDRDRVQCCGVRYYPFFGVSRLVLKNEPLTAITPQRLRKERIDFQHGASLLLSREMIAATGLMDERFFLYFEEHDWQLRAEQSGFGNRLVPESLVYHKGSMSTDHARYLFFYHYNTSAAIFTLKHNPVFLRICSLLCLTGITAIRTRLQPKSFFWGIKGLIHGLKKYRYAAG